MKKSKSQVQGTNDYNTVSKCSMIKNGYFKDEYVHYFVEKCNRRAPLIHLGYYMRMLTVDFTLRSFLDEMSDSAIQIISCGAGFDTAFFRFANEGLLRPNVIFYEVDFEEVVERKTACILKSESLQECIGAIHANPVGVKGLLTSQYRLIAGDLQFVDQLQAKLVAVGLKFDVPSLLLAECAICYMDDESGSKLIEWAASKFADATFVTYEQIHPEDGFGVVMQKHFEDMKSPLLQLSKYPNLAAQEGRYLSRGWTSCKTWTAFEMFLKIATLEERKKIMTLEPFDEFEECHLEGCHFALMVASKGVLVDWFLKSVNSHKSRDDCEDKRTHIQWTLNMASVNRFAHRTVFLNQVDEKSAIVIGGFGPSSEAMHGRRSEVLKITTRHGNEGNDCEDIHVEKIKSEVGVQLDALHHSCTRLSFQTNGCTRILVYGGRYSPRKPVNTWPLILNIYNDGQEMSVTNIETTKSDKFPEPRWRHSAVCVKFDQEDQVFMFGGRTPEFKVLDDLCIWIVKAGGAELTWTEVEHTSDSKWPCARFSHSAVVWQDKNVVVSGGLSEDVFPLSDIWCYSVDTRTWREISVCGMLPRYSHTSSVYGDNLILMGGVNISPGRQPGVCVVNLLTQTCIEYTLPAQDPSHPVMLHNHTSEMIDDKTVLIIGGGGNCFSFGTMFNNHVMKISVDNFR